MNFVDEQVVARLYIACVGGLTPLQVQPADGKARQGQARDQPAVGLAGVRGPIEREEEKGRSRSCQRRHHQRQSRGFGQVAKKREKRGAIKQVHGGIFAQSPDRPRGLHKRLETGIDGHRGGTRRHQTATDFFQFLDRLLHVRLG